MLLTKLVIYRHYSISSLGDGGKSEGIDGSRNMNSHHYPNIDIYSILK